MSNKEVNHNISVCVCVCVSVGSTIFERSFLNAT